LTGLSSANSTRRPGPAAGGGGSAGGRQAVGVSLATVRTTSSSSAGVNGLVSQAVRPLGSLGGRAPGGTQTTAGPA
jgi:hypothetical protein